ncbi:hypothetical protein D3C73_1424030 [compost metagenome]
MPGIEGHTFGIGQRIEGHLQGITHLLDPGLRNHHVRGKHTHQVIGREQVQLRIALQRQGIGCADEGAVE